MKESEYRNYPAESYSSLKYLLESPEVFKYYKENPFKGSTSTLLGTCVHHYLQGNRHLVAFPPVDRRKKDEFAKFEKEFTEIAGEEGIIAPKSFEKKLNHIMKNTNTNNKVQEILTRPDVEFEKPFISQYDGCKLKFKMDMYHPDELGEIKTSSKATTVDEFRNEAYDRDYDLQSFMYQMGAYNWPTDFKPHKFIVINTIAPFQVNVYKASEKFLLSGKEKFIKVMDRYKRFIIGTEVWVSDGLEEI